MAGKKGRSGRKKSVYHVYADWVEAARTNGTVAKIMDKLTELALNGDKDAGFYIVDRCEGKARISIDQRIHGALVSATPEDYKDEGRIL